jgi:hypothetical protein
MGIPVTLEVAQRIAELYAQAEAALLSGEANMATGLRDQAYRLEQAAAAAERR